MLAAAALVLWGGERLSRHDVEEREPVDRLRLLDFSTTLGKELDRLDSLYDSHLMELVALTSSRAQAVISGRCESVLGVRSLCVFGPGGKKSAEYSGMRPTLNSGRHVPTVETDEDRGFHATNVIP